MTAQSNPVNYYAIINGINAVVSIGVFFFILLRRPRGPLQLTYAFFSLSLFGWTSTYFLWSLQTAPESSFYYLRLLHYPVSFIHGAYFHFVCHFTGTSRKHRLEVAAGYISAALSVLINYQTGFYNFDIHRPRGPFPFWPLATPQLTCLIAVQSYFFIRALFVLYTSFHESKAPARKIYGTALIFSLVGWLGGTTNWFYSYDTLPIPPFGNLGLAFYLLFMCYLIGRHDILGLNIMMKRTALHTVSAMIITALFFVGYLMTDHHLRRNLTNNSLTLALFVSFLLALTISPIMNALEAILSRILFGKTIGQLSDENERLITEVGRIDQVRSVATLAAGMAHEIKNPLTAIKTFAEHLPAKASDPVFLEKFRRIVGQEVDKIDSIVRQVLEFSRPQANIADTVAVNELLDSTLELLNAQMVRNKIDVERALVDGLPPVTADRKLLQQAFLNILINAIEAMPAGGHLRVSTQLRDGSIRILISDTGCGISSAALPRIFDPFYSDKEAGTGLGLSIVKGIMDQHRGKISVRSVVGQGAEFTLSLPISGGAHQHA